jgi:glutathione synthase/RimK-type ligase-like ATP-grasp enzyme
MGDSVADVVVVANGDDAHAQAVIEELITNGRVAVRFNLADLRSSGINSNFGLLRLDVGPESYSINEGSSVWWRWMGQVDTSGLKELDVRFAVDEAPYLLTGILDAAGSRFVDDPYAIYRAELKPRQLWTAQQCGITTPATLITNRLDSASSFISSQRVVAKALSPGVGITPFVDEIFPADLTNVLQLPVMLQELIFCTSDLRVVVVGDEALIWTRPREDGTLDWRQRDPSGTGFKMVDMPELQDMAVKLTAELGISMSVQDWLETPNGPVFLESNAQGAWLFLQNAAEHVVPRLAKHVATRP